MFKLDATSTFLESKSRGERVEINNTRYYQIDGQIKISVTKMLNIISKGYGFHRWLGNSKSYDDAMAYAREKASLGTDVHDSIESLFKGKVVKPSNIELEKRLESFMGWYEEYQPIPLLIEERLAHPDYPYGGTLDFMGIINGKIVIGDWKTGNVYKPHFIQLSCYAYLVEAIYGIKPQELWIQQFKDYKTRGYYPKPKKAEIVPIEVINNVYGMWRYINGNELKKAQRLFDKQMSVKSKAEQREDKNVYETEGVF